MNKSSHALSGTDDPGAVAASLIARLDALLADADAALTRDYPGEAPARQPVHTVYVPADLMHPDLPEAWGTAALAAIDEHADLFAEIAGATGAAGGAGSGDLVPRVRAKLAAEPVEDLRLDFEDGYGDRGDDAEDADALAAATALAAAIAEGTAPPYRGLRVKSLEAPTRRRGVRTLTLFLSRLLEAGGTLADLVITLPKVTSVAQVRAMVELVEGLEGAWGLAPRSLRFELQIETPQSILGPDGTALVAPMVHAGDGRVTALHYGTYDYSAFCGVPPAYQSMEHPVADHAKLVMQAAAAGTGVRLSDGSTNILPVGDRVAVRRGWELHSRLVRRSLERGYYQGWDLHPAQLPTRFAATYAFYRAELPPAAERLRNYLHRVESSVLDEPATARALADLVVRGVDCGAVTPDEVREGTEVEHDTLLELARPRRM